MQDSNPRPRLRRPEGYPDYPNRPVFTELASLFEGVGVNEELVRVILRYLKPKMG